MDAVESFMPGTQLSPGKPTVAMSRDCDRSAQIELQSKHDINDAVRIDETHEGKLFNAARIHLESNIA